MYMQVCLPVYLSHSDAKITEYMYTKQYRNVVVWSM